MTKKVTIEIPILYGSQTGNAQGAAEDLAEIIPDRLSTDDLIITSRAISLDDFLEIELVSSSYTPLKSSDYEIRSNLQKQQNRTHGMMPPIFCVVSSSYGVGQAPLGAYRFRELCDHIISSSDDDISTLWNGCTYAMLGLGDSNYTTYFLNPIALDGGISKAGARRVGALGKADVQGEEKTQAEVIKEWSESVVSDLELVLKERKASVSNTKDDDEAEELYNMAERTLSICEEIFDDWVGEQRQQRKIAFTGALVVLVPILLTLYFVFFMRETNENRSSGEL